MARLEDKIKQERALSGRDPNLVARALGEERIALEKWRDASFADLLRQLRDSGR
jgi:hypothetical protein